MTASTREAMARQLWLSYFNRVLHQRGLITQEEYRNGNFFPKQQAGPRNIPQPCLLLLW